MCDAEEERDELLEEVNILENNIAELEGKLEAVETKNMMVVLCPICHNNITQDVIDGLICKGCRTIFVLSQKVPS